ncbi:AfsR/SARP family transcriptional regulator [Kitasatospora atroaurantiaca]|uniref:DNA-binding SARP family transcriptional activator n=1 Tax=Kitasatospora atroaurantiaca TaxID=285545 RepID=A0A561ENP5_9ACTN|nr:AfsR/SARP family transcriptional regulator [Kitasatospora atroaurantiaca]TWE17237.1 DNA-binding SARP family transcriptional activator [Kitasatospora atroaurantiaca]
MIHFGVLGALELTTDQGDRTPRGPKVRKVLALLLLNANQVVSVDALTTELWDGEPPNAALSTVRTHVYHLRRLLAEADPDGAEEAGELIVTRPPGYLLRLRDNQLDLRLFGRLVSQGRALIDERRLAEARERLDQALSLWRGLPLADVLPGQLLTGHISGLAELRTQALELRIDVDLRLGRHRELVAELRDLVAAHPLNEWYHARLIDALHRSGRRGDALAAVDDLRTLLDRELGLQPSREIRQLQYEILTSHDRWGEQPRDAQRHHWPAQQLPHQRGRARGRVGVAILPRTDG